METSAPDPSKRAGVAKMPRAARAYACWLAVRAGWPINRATWGIVEDTRQVVVEHPHRGATFGVPWTDSEEEVLDAIETRYGPGVRRQAEAAIA